MSTQNKPRLYDGETFELDGLTFRVQFPNDDIGETPWEHSDGCHGTVSDWTRRDKRAGELILCSDHNSKRYYDYADAVKTARADGWDTEPYNTGTPGERAARAAMADYEFLRAWCNDEWCYVGCVVTLLDIDDNTTRETESVWAIESNSVDYLTETAYELASEIIARVGTSSVVCQRVRKPEVSA